MARATETEATIPTLRGIYREAWPIFDQRLHGLLQRDDVTRVCEVGGGANPKLPLEQVRELGLEYTVLDISAAELAKAPAGYRTVVADIANNDGLNEPGTYDVVFSHMLAEHITHPAAMHRNIHRMLRSGGWAVHFFPTLYDPAFVANRLTPERASAAVLSRLQSHRSDEGSHGKFPAYYRWCRGPSARQVQRFQRLGFAVESFDAFYGTGYLDRGPLRPVNRWVARAFLRSEWVWLTSYAVVVLRRRV
jgi:SAM-dependent methyltransferase